MEFGFSEFALGLALGVFSGVAFNNCTSTQPLRSQCIAEKTAACREAHANDTGAYLECVKPVAGRCSP